MKLPPLLFQLPMLLVLEKNRTRHDFHPDIVNEMLQVIAL